jgi:maltooligosyltrehalose synthase
MSALSTHDSKRSHDVRCRLAALSEVAESWAESVAMLDKAATAIEIDAAERRYIYQTIVGAWPVSGELDDAFVPRVRNHLVKAAREAKRHSSWVAPDLEHEAALGDFVEHLIGDSASTTVEVLETVVTDIEHAAATNSMASVLVRAAAPGVPDIYQNDDSWFHALVDPDNRAPLDGGRLALVSELPDLIGLDLLHAWRDGRLKQALIRAGLRLRRSQPALFVAAGYRPIEAAGTHADHVVAFERRLSDESVVCVVPRLTRALVGPGRFPTGECWADTAIGLPAAAGGYLDVLTGHRIGAGDQVSVATLLATLPVALLHADGV